VIAEAGVVANAIAAAHPRPIAVTVLNPRCFQVSRILPSVEARRESHCPGFEGSLGRAGLTEADAVIHARFRLLSMCQAVKCRKGARLGGPFANMVPIIAGQVAMVRAAIAIGTSLVISSPLFGAEIRFRTMKVPPQANVQIEGSAARISSGRLGIETVWNCSCTKGEGTCTIEHIAGAINCSKGTTDTCEADCFLSLDLGGLLGR
jgi:hypothetical protein